MTDLLLAWLCIGFIFVILDDHIIETSVRVYAEERRGNIVLSYIIGYFILVVCTLAAGPLMFFLRGRKR